MPAAPSEDALYFTPSYSRSLKVLSLAFTARSIAACASSSSSTVAITAPRKSSSARRDGAPDGDLLAQPGRDVLLVVELRVLGLRERLLDELVDLRLRVGGAQHLARGRERVVALRRPRDGRSRRRRRRRSPAATPGRHPRVLPAPQPVAMTGQQDESEENDPGHRRSVRPEPRGTQETLQIGALQALRALNVRRRHFPPTSQHRLFAGIFCHTAIRFKIGGTEVDNCVAEWERVGYLPSGQPVRGGGAPPTPPPRID